MRIIRHFLFCLFISTNVGSVSAVNWSRLITPAVRAFYHTRIRPNSSETIGMSAAIAYAASMIGICFYLGRNSTDTTPRFWRFPHRS